METQLSVLANIASDYLIAGKEPERRWGTAHPSVVPYQAFSCLDGKQIIVGAGNDLHFVKFCSVIGSESLATDQRFRYNRDRVKNRKELIQLIEDRMRTKNRSEWVEIFTILNEFPFGPVRTVKESFTDEQAIHRHMVTTVEHTRCGKISLVGSPAKFSRTPTSVRHPPPTLGEHTEDILKNILGYSTEHIVELVGKKVVDIVKCC